MSDSPKVTNPTPATIKGVSVEHPSLIDGIRNCAMNGYSKEHAQAVIGAPREIIDREYRNVENAKK